MVFNKPASARYLLGVDLAKTLDYTSFAIVRMIPDPVEGFVYRLMGLDRIRGIEYPSIVDLILKAMDRLKMETGGLDGPHLCMDASGLGAPIRDYLKPRFDSTRSRIFPVVFTGGENARFNRDTGNYNISKTLIIANFKNLRDRERFKIARGLQAYSFFEEEIARFKYRQTSSGKITFDAESGAHDDLICAICIPLIIGEWQFNQQLTTIEIPSKAIASGGYSSPALSARAISIHRRNQHHRL